MSTDTQISTAGSELGSRVQNYRAGIDQVRFWVGTALGAVITGLTAFVGLLLIRNVLDIAILVTERHHLIPVDLTAYALVTAAVVVGVSALYNLMLHVAPHPGAYYGALVAVGITLAVLLPFTVPVALASQIALAGLNLVVGLVIAFLVPLAAVSPRW